MMEKIKLSKNALREVRRHKSMGESSIGMGGLPKRGVAKVPVTLRRAEYEKAKAT